MEFLSSKVGDEVLTELEILGGCVPDFNFHAAERVGEHDVELAQSQVDAQALPGSAREGNKVVIKFFRVGLAPPVRVEVERVLPDVGVLVHERVSLTDNSVRGNDVAVNVGFLGSDITGERGGSTNSESEGFFHNTSEQWQFFKFFNSGGGLAEVGPDFAKFSENAFGEFRLIPG